MLRFLCRGCDQQHSQRAAVLSVTEELRLTAAMQQSLNTTGRHCHHWRRLAAHQDGKPCLFTIPLPSEDQLSLIQGTQRAKNGMWHQCCCSVITRCSACSARDVRAYAVAATAAEPTLQAGCIVEFKTDSRQDLALLQRPNGKINWFATDVR